MSSQDAREIKLPAAVVPAGPARISRQQLRVLGRKEAEARVRGVLMHKEEPVISRRERRALVRQAHKKAWEARDKQLVRRVTGGNGDAATVLELREKDSVIPATKDGQSDESRPQT